jgi:alpha-L-arabinofuranosidase
MTTRDYIDLVMGVLALLPTVLRIFKFANRPWAVRLMAVGNDFIGAWKGDAK